MGLRGPKSKAPGGRGYVTPKGYIRLWDAEQDRYRMEHDVVWERAYGPVPDGYDVHHKDDVKSHNRLDNLELLSKLAHKRLHSGCELRDGEWWKPCRKCGTWNLLASHYKRKDGISPWCRACCIANAVENKRKRKEV